MGLGPGLPAGRHRRPLLQHGVSMVARLFRRGWFWELLLWLLVLELARVIGGGSERPSRQFPRTGTVARAGAGAAIGIVAADCFRLAC